MGLVDWNAIWNAQIQPSRRARLNAGRFWDETAERGQANDSFPDALRTRHLQHIAARSDDTVLEIGPGMGPLTVPLPHSARSVTVIDSSERMLAHLRARAAGVANLRTVRTEIAAFVDTQLHDTDDGVALTHTIATGALRWQV